MLRKHYHAFTGDEHMLVLALSY